MIVIILLIDNPMVREILDDCTDIELPETELPSHPPLSAKSSATYSHDSGRFSRTGDMGSPVWATQLSETSFSTLHAESATPSSSIPSCSQMTSEINTPTTSTPTYTSKISSVGLETFPSYNIGDDKGAQTSK